MKTQTKRLSDKKSLLIIGIAIATYILVTWYLGADYSESFSRICY